MNRKIEDIEIGDEVVFESSKEQNNHDDYWTVTGKYKEEIIIEFTKFGLNEAWTIHISEVRGHLPTSKNRKEN